MAVHAIGGTLTASTATAATLTGWEKYIIVTATAPSTVAGTLSVTTDGTTATVNGNDTASVRIPASGSVTVAVKNNLPRPALSTTTPLATDPSASAAFTTYGSKVSVISDLAAPFSVDLAEDPGTLPVYS
jgi:hypothetical protein